MTRWLLASLPSPPGKFIHIGPLELRAYGLAIALGVVAAVAIAQRRWRRAGGNPDDTLAVSATVFVQRSRAKVPVPHDAKVSS